MDSLNALLSRLFTLHRNTIELSLGRIERLLAALGSPEARLPPVIHVAGTNGKGSTIAFMRAILEAAGKRVHVYTSPHLVRFHERIRLGTHGRLVGDTELFAALTACETANAGQPITFFEVTTAAAFKLFSEHPADYLLLETGLGGRYDATNVIARPAATVITPISIDHPEFLGATVDKIAYEKAGIFKADTLAILSTQEDAALAVLEREARRVGAPVIAGGRDYDSREENGRLVFEDSRGLLDLPPPHLIGRHQHQNAATAIAALRAIEPHLAASAFEDGVIGAQWPARLQNLAKGHVGTIAPEGSEIWLDGGHNEDAGRVLAQSMAELEDKRQRPLVIICGSLASKDTGAFLRAFKGLAQEVVAVPVNADQYAKPAAEVAAAATANGIPAASCGSVKAALAYLAARNWPAPPRILIAGSLYLAGEVLALNGTPPN
ncbi:bifunctional folylpolyglutamate synthase/dihydrofolate synthase [Methylocapsa sp. D3K7]|uniref:bifunctional folylpolyglutamate synthase/dihydrofolate synthase n=1 Tax=Methylocapsa sp. D3K7 TaxID=3041435 RepID=UPI00244E6A90|nr:folylpolyglutamate synthase/dihydrofolate synthase family protein [Methylocapsa sp. D3K7]WGJ14278.1 bifunctional folylpolyglutamate synthase/dihydrofolate synthase [Methylocapsa sp. D3K7]